MKNYFDFTGSKILIVGGHSGLGKEMAKGFIAHGATVALAGRDEVRLKTAAAEIGAHFAWTVDVTQPASVEALAKKASDQWNGTVNVVINSAGFNVRNLIGSISFEEWQSIIATNLSGAFLLSKTFQPLLKAASFGRLIHLASIFSSVSYPERTSYAASKGGVLQLCRTLAAEWAKDGITVNSISPGPFMTEMNRKVLDNPENYRKFCERIPMARFGEPQEVVTSALFLAAPTSSYVTGSDIVIDGGWTAT